MTDAAPHSQALAARAGETRRAFAQVDVHASPDAILADWRDLAATAPASAYQTEAFVLAWLDTLGKARGLEPMFVTARDAAGRAIALLCLGIEKHGGVRRAVFLGGKENNFNLGLFRVPDRFGRADIEALLREAARALGRRAPDVFVLTNQPRTWAGAANPFCQLAHQASPSYGYGTQLTADPEAYFAARHSKERRKKLRKKEAHLARIGALSHLCAADHDTLQAGLAAFLAQKQARCEAQALDADFSDPAVQAFYTQSGAPRPGAAPALELHQLRCGSRIVAVFGGMRHRDQFSGMIISFDGDPEIARTSPGELLLTKAIASECRSGVADFDLGVGEADYKATYCETPIPLIDVLFPLSMKGALYAAALAAQLRLKRAIKQQPRFFSAVQKLKRTVVRVKRRDRMSA
jgi:CelD/BcsL family acetyltransferase involved in cellulose biosynthesis